MIFSPTQIKTLLSKYGVRPSKSLGQNFLIDQNILEKIIEASSIKKTETILEVGPGLGTLTQELAKNASRVIAVEKDSTMCEILKETLANYKNIEVINANILQTPGVCKENYKVVANIPYYLTSPLIRLFRGRNSARIYGFNGPKRSGPKNYGKTSRNEPSGCVCAILCGCQN